MHEHRESPICGANKRSASCRKSIRGQASATSSTISEAGNEPHKLDGDWAGPRAATKHQVPRLRASPEDDDVHPTPPITAHSRWSSKRLICLAARAFSSVLASHACRPEPGRQDLVPAHTSRDGGNYRIRPGRYHGPRLGLRWLWRIPPNAEMPLSDFAAQRRTALHVGTSGHPRRAHCAGAATFSR